LPGVSRIGRVIAAGTFDGGFRENLEHAKHDTVHSQNKQCIYTKRIYFLLLIGSILKATLVKQLVTCSHCYYLLRC